MNTKADREGTPEAKSGSTRRRWLVWGMVVSIILLLFSPFVLFRAVNRAAFERKIAELKAAGQPVSMDDLEAAYVLPEGVENAADLYLQAFKAYVEPNEAELALLPIRGKFTPTDDMPPYPPEVIEAIGVSLEKNKECLELLDKASRMAHCLFPRLREGVFFTSEHLNELVQSSILLSERNLYLAQAQQVDALYESTLTGFRLAQALDMQPILIEYFVSKRMKSIAAQQLEESLNLALFTEKQLGELQRRVRFMQCENNFSESLDYERVCLIEIARSINDLSAFVSGSSRRQKILFSLYAFFGLKDKDSVLLLEYHDKASHALQSPLHEQQAEMQKLEKGLAEYSQVHCLFTFRPAIASVHKIGLGVTGRLMCAEMAVAVERYRLEYGKEPERLGELVPEFLPEVYLDPFDGKPLRYVLRAEGGYVIYTIGPDGVDNGGLSREQLGRTGAAGSDEEDFPFTVKR